MQNESTKTRNENGDAASEASDNNALLSVPCGWQKAEPLVVKQRRVHGEKVWWVEQRPSFNFSKDLPPRDAVAAKWFYTLDEFTRFIVWWNEAR